MNKLIALWMGERDGDKPWNLNYDSPDHFARLTKRLFEQEKMWKEFRRHAFNAWLSEDEHHYDDTSALFETWLFSDRTRFVTLFAEFLRLPETRRKFGWEECTSDNRSNDCMQDRDECRLQIGKMGSSTGKRCLGKILSAWAREVNNA